MVNGACHRYALLQSTLESVWPWRCPNLSINVVIKCYLLDYQVKSPPNPAQYASFSSKVSVLKPARITLRCGGQPTARRCRCSEVWLQDSRSEQQAERPSLFISEEMMLQPQPHMDSHIRSQNDGPRWGDTIQNPKRWSSQDLQFLLLKWKLL